MDNAEDVTALNDPEFFEERKRVRELLEHQPAAKADPELTARMQRLNEEFDRRAGQAWAASW